MYCAGFLELGEGLGGTYLADKLHVTVLNTVVDHLDVVTGTLVTDPLTAGLAVALGGNGLEDVLDEGPGLVVTTGHHGRTESSALLTTGNTGADKADALGREVSGPAVGVGEMRVTTIDDDVTTLKKREEALDPVIHGLSGLHKKHNPAGLLELGDELLRGVGAYNGLALGLIGEEAVDLGDGSVEGADGKSVVGHVQNQILTPRYRVLDAIPSHEPSQAFLPTKAGA